MWRLELKKNLGWGFGGREKPLSFSHTQKEEGEKSCGGRNPIVFVEQTDVRLRGREHGEG